MDGIRQSLEQQPDIQPGQELPERVTMGVTVKAWGVANSLTGFTTISFCGLYLSVIFIILSCSVLAFEQLSAIEQNLRPHTDSHTGRDSGTGEEDWQVYLQGACPFQ